MEILEKFDSEMAIIMASDAEWPEPQKIAVRVNGELFCEVRNEKWARPFSLKKARILREAFRGCRATWKYEEVKRTKSFMIEAVEKSHKKWEKIRRSLYKSNDEEKAYERLSYEEHQARNKYAERLWRRVCQIINDPVEQEDAFRINMKRKSTSPYNFGSTEGLKKMLPIYELGGYEALGRNEYWWSDAISILQEHPESDWATMKKRINFRKKFPMWNDAYAFHPEAMSYVNTFIDKFKREEGEEPHIYKYDREICNRVCDILSQPPDVVESLPNWAVYCILKAGETPKYWSFPEDKPSVPGLVYRSIQEGSAVEATRKWLGILDLPKKVAGRMYGKICSAGEYVNTNKIIREEAGIDPGCRNLPRNWSNWLLFQWLGKKFSNPAMRKVHVVHGPAGRTVSFSYIEKLDELHNDDLVNGVNTKPDVAFERAARRLEEKARLDMGENMKFNPAPFKAAKGIRQLMDSNSLKEEGRHMNNCVSGYAGACLRGATYVFHVAEKNAEATMEVTAEKRMLQLYAANNSEPAESVRKLAFKWARDNAIDTSDCNQRN